MIREALCVLDNDLRQWVRRPIQILMAVAPLVMVLICVGAFLASAESLPTGVILQDDDPVAVEIAAYIGSARSGTGLQWWTVASTAPLEVVDMYESGEILCYITVPANISDTLESGGVVKLDARINNVNDDVTKNVKQRLELVCNHFNDKITIGDITYQSVSIDFRTLAETDVSFRTYIIAGVLALTIQLTSCVSTAAVTAREYEEKTIKSLLMGSSLPAVALGKLLSGIAQTSIVYLLILGFVRVFYRFVPQGGYPATFLYGFIDILCYCSLGFLTAIIVRKTVSSALAMILLNMVAWWIGGGMVPSEVWSSKLIGYIGSMLPEMYFYRSYTSLVLTNTTHTMLFDLGVNLLFGLTLMGFAVWRFQREATRL